MKRTGVKERLGWEDRESCVLDVTDGGPMPQNEVARILGTSQQMVDQAERRGLMKLNRSGKLAGFK
jgi:DNA-directed RNA polymerase specialized sigma subunit